MAALRSSPWQVRQANLLSLRLQTCIRISLPSWRQTRCLCNRISKVAIFFSLSVFLSLSTLSSFAVCNISTLSHPPTLQTLSTGSSLDIATMPRLSSLLHLCTFCMHSFTLVPFLFHNILFSLKGGHLRLAMSQRPSLQLTSKSAPALPLLSFTYHCVHHSILYTIGRWIALNYESDFLFNNGFPDPVAQKTLQELIIRAPDPVQYHFRQMVRYYMAPPRDHGSPRRSSLNS